MKHLTVFQKTLRPVSLLLTALMLCLTLPAGYASAALIGTEAVMDAARADSARAYVRGLMAREDVHKALVSQGIDPEQARQRIDSLFAHKGIRT